MYTTNIKEMYYKTNTERKNRTAMKRTYIFTYADNRKARVTAESLEQAIAKFEKRYRTVADSVTWAN